jgi:hypothetical protein
LFAVPRIPVGNTFVNTLLEESLIAAAISLKVMTVPPPNAVSFPGVLPEGAPHNQIHIVLHGNAAIWCPQTNIRKCHIVDNINHKPSLFAFVIT